MDNNDIKEQIFSLLELQHRIHRCIRDLVKIPRENPTTRCGRLADVNKSLLEIGERIINVGMRIG